MAWRGASGKIALGLLGLLAAVALAVHPIGKAGAVGEPGFTCKRIHRGTAQVNPNPRGRPPLIIGDSTTLLPIPNLTAAGFAVNARGCRGFGEAIGVARAIEAKGKLPHLVLINDYGNGGLSTKLVAKVLEVMGSSRVLGLVTEYDADTGKAPAPETWKLFRAARSHPRRIFVLDWVKFSLPHHFADPAEGAWFLADLFHPNFAGADAYAQFLSAALPLARDGSVPPLR